MLPGVILTRLKRISAPLGDVLHGIKVNDPGYQGFGEAYFTTVRQNSIKGWKRHRDMVLNLICISGAVRLVVHDGLTGAGHRLQTLLSPEYEECYQRLTVSPGLWVGFQGVDPGLNMLVNFANITHDPAESENCDLAAFPWLQ